MKILVGTLYTIENEFEQCLAGIRQQTYTNFENFVLKDLPNKEAHERLYQTFMEGADEFDLFMKVDADMVIENKHLFARIVDKFNMTAWVKDLIIAVHDFFSDQLIWGMHTYRNTVRWSRNEEHLFVDDYPGKDDEVILDDSELAPAAVHCKDPSPFQSFHYGVHRGLKVIQPGRAELHVQASRDHWENLQKTWLNFLRTNDRRIAFATLGAELVFKGGIQPHHLDYANPYLRNLFRRYERLSPAQLKQKIRRISFTGFAFLPSELRRRVLLAVSKSKTRGTLLFDS